MVCRVHIRASVSTGADYKLVPGQSIGERDAGRGRGTWEVENGEGYPPHPTPQPTREFGERREQFAQQFALLHYMRLRIVFKLYKMLWKNWNFTGAKIHLCPGCLTGTGANFPLALWSRHLCQPAITYQSQDIHIISVFHINVHQNLHKCVVQTFFQFHPLLPSSLLSWVIFYHFYPEL